MKRNKCYSFSCDFPMRYVNGCPESKTLPLKYQIWEKTDYSYFCQSIAAHDSKMLKWRKNLQRIILRFSNFGPNWDNIGGFSLMGQGIGKSPAPAKNLLILFPPPRKIPQLVDSPTKSLSPSTKSLNIKFHVLTK